MTKKQRLGPSASPASPGTDEQCEKAGSLFSGRRQHASKQDLTRPSWRQAGARPTKGTGNSSPYVTVLAGHCHILLCDVDIHVIQGGLLCYVVGADKVQPIRGLTGQARPSEGTPDKILTLVPKEATPLYLLGTAKVDALVSSTTDHLDISGA